MPRTYPDPPIGPVLRAFRQARGLTIEEAARRAKVHIVYLGDIERSKRNPTVQVLDRILSALKVSWGEFGAEIDVLRTTPPHQPASRN
jgi:transcriptional regulator with XRE-family HTH domain